MALRVKICGITQYEDAKTAVGLGVDALGFIFYAKSPRYIEPARAREIIRRLPPYVARVGVFVDESPDMVLRIVEQTGIDTLQLHGSESPEYCARFGPAVVKAFSVASGSDLSALDDYDVAGFLLDTWDERRAGGTGKTFDWSIAAEACRRHDRVILAGGLGPTNLAEAIQAVRPYGVDLNSGVEIKPGQKNPYKMREALSIVRACGG